VTTSKTDSSWLCVQYSLLCARLGPCVQVIDYVSIPDFVLEVGDVCLLCIMLSMFVLFGY